MATIAVTTGSHAWQMLHWDLTPHQAKWRDMVVLKFGHKLLSPNSPCGHYQLSLVLSSKPLEIDMNVSSSISQSVLVLLFGAFLKHLETMIWIDLAILGVLFLFKASVRVLFVHPKNHSSNSRRCRYTGTVKARAARLPSAELMAAGKPGHPGSCS